MQINIFVFKLTEIEFRCKIGRNIKGKTFSRKKDWRVLSSIEIECSNAIAKG